MPSPGEMRISDADREAAAGRLHTAMGEGRITLVELEERLGVVYAARTYTELEPPLADLPGAGTIVPPAAVPVGAGSGPVRAERVHLRTDLGEVRRSGDWRVPTSLRLTTRLGSMHLDLTEAASLPPRIDVEVSVGVGEIVIVLPVGATADVDGVRGAWGEVSSKVPAAPSATGPHLTITGRTGMGALKVRGPKLSWRTLFS